MLAAGLACLLITAVGLSQPSQPPILEERWDNLSGAWQFRTDPTDAGVAARWFRPSLPSAGWRTLKVPGYWEEQGVTDPPPGRPAEALPGVMWNDYNGVAWYRLEFRIPSGWQDKPLTLRLGKVDDLDTVWVNGHRIGSSGEGAEHPSQVERRYAIPARWVRPHAVNTLAIRVEDRGGPGGITGPTLTLLPEEVMTRPVRNPWTKPSDPLEVRFATPPAEDRILPITHMLPVSEDARLALMASLVSRGFGGIATNVSFDQYMQSTEHWDALRHMVKLLHGESMALWLYDEQGYPSAAAGGQVLERDASLQARGLLQDDVPASPDQPVDLPLPPGNLVLARAYPVVNDRITTRNSLDLTDRCVNNRLTWTPESGNWRVVVITDAPLHEGTHASIALHDTSRRYVDLLNPRTTTLFLETTHRRYGRELGEPLGQWFTSTFIDEPSLMSLWLNNRQPWRVVPWTPDLAEAFQTARGYDIRPELAALFLDTGERTALIRYDFWRTIGDLLAARFFRPIREWCDTQGMASGGHLLIEESLIDQVPLYGDFFACLRELSAPSIDCLTSIPEDVPFGIGRLAASAAALNGNPLTMCEASDHVQRWRPAGDTRPAVMVTEDQIRGSLNRLLLSGIQVITSYYTWTGLDNAALNRINTWTGRVSTMLRGGQITADVGLLWPVHSLWGGFQPSRQQTAENGEAVRAVERAYHAAQNSLYSTGREWTILDADTLQQARVTQGSLEWRSQRWRVLVLPGVDTLPADAWQAILAFNQTGGAVVLVGALPANSERARPDADVQRVTAALQPLTSGGIRALSLPGAGPVVFIPYGQEQLTGQVVDALLESDIHSDGWAQGLRMTHRQKDGRSTYLLINDSAQPLQTNITLRTDSPVQVWDPNTGSHAALQGNSTALVLGPYDARLITCDAPARPARRQVNTGTFQFGEEHPLSVAESLTGGGEHVDGRLETLPDGVLVAHARITKTNENTHQFVVRRLSEPLTLHPSDMIRITGAITQAPEEGPMLLCILRDRRGSEVFAPLNVPVSQGVRFDVLLPRSLFAPAGWRDQPGVIDWTQIDSLSIGWGGYYGVEGQQLAVRTDPPRLVRVQQR